MSALLERIKTVGSGLKFREIPVVAPTLNPKPKTKKLANVCWEEFMYVREDEDLGVLPSVQGVIEEQNAPIVEELGVDNNSHARHLPDFDNNYSTKSLNSHITTKRPQSMKYSVSAESGLISKMPVKHGTPLMSRDQKRSADAALKREAEVVPHSRVMSSVFGASKMKPRTSALAKQDVVVKVYVADTSDEASINSLIMASYYVTTVPGLPAYAYESAFLTIVYNYLDYSNDEATFKECAAACRRAVQTERLNRDTITTITQAFMEKDKDAGYEYNILKCDFNGDTPDKIPGNVSEDFTDHMIFGLSRDEFEVIMEYGPMIASPPAGMADMYFLVVVIAECKDSKEEARYNEYLKDKKNGLVRAGVTGYENVPPAEVDAKLPHPVFEFPPIVTPLTDSEKGLRREIFSGLVYIAQNHPDARIKRAFTTTLSVYLNYNALTSYDLCVNEILKNAPEVAGFQFLSREIRAIELFKAGCNKHGTNLESFAGYLRLPEAALVSTQSCKFLVTAASGVREVYAADWDKWNKESLKKGEMGTRAASIANNLKEYVLRRKDCGFSGNYNPDGATGSGEAGQRLDDLSRKLREIEYKSDDEDSSDGGESD